MEGVFMNSRFDRSIILGGQGAVGQLFAKILRSAGEVTLVDLCRGAPEPGVSSIVADACRPSPRLITELAQADIVIIALPEQAGAAAVESVAPYLPQGALLAETLSVKSTIEPILTSAAERYELEALGLNPMFAPDLGFQGQPVVMVEVRGGPRYRHLQSLINAQGAQLVFLSAHQHDRLTASLQVATHATVLAFGWALDVLDADIGVAAVAAPPPHRTLLALLARIVTGTRAVYRDIQFAHPYAHEVRRVLRDALIQLDETAMAKSADSFDDMLNKIVGRLGAYREELTCDCASLFAHLTESSAPARDPGHV